jgi:tetratricopeptide (TPR) repeat protein
MHTIHGNSMRIKILALFMLLSLGIDYTVAESIQSQQQSINKLSEEDKYKIYLEIDSKLNERLKPYVLIFDKLSYFYTSLSALMAIILGYHIYNQSKLKSDAKKQINERIKKEVKSAVALSINNSKKKIDIKFEGKLKEGIEKFDKLISLEHEKHQLLLAVQDIDAPPLQHIVSDENKKEILIFLEEIKKLRGELNNGDIANTNYNQEIAGKAYHYIEKYDDAIRHFNIILKSNSNFNEERIRLCLGHSLAGNKDYPLALDQYKNINQQTSDKTAIQVHIDKGNAYRGMVNFHEAIKEFSKVKNQREIYKDRYYWESLYGEATSYVDIGEYKNAEISYNKIINGNCNDPAVINPVWLYVSIGDCYKKQGDYENSECSYNKALELSKKINDTGLGVISYKLGRLYVDMGKYIEANKAFKKSFFDENGKLYYQNRLQIFWGY